MNNTITDKYFAGFFDGEGCVGIYKIGRKIRYRNPYYQLVVSITNTNLVILKIFKEKFGGYIVTLKKRKENHTQAYLWKIASIQAKDFLNKILPYSLLKSPQIKYALVFQDCLRKSSNPALSKDEIKFREDASNKMKYFKKVL